MRWCLLSGLLLFPCACGGTHEGDGKPGNEIAVGIAPLTPHSELIQNALPRFAAAADRSWPPPTPGMTALNQALAQGRINRARRLVAQELALHPSSEEASFAAGVLYYLGGAYSEARKRFERSLATGPSFPDPHRVFHFYGACLLRLGEAKLAREALEAHLTLRPQDPHTIYYLGLLSLQEGHADEAVTRFKFSISKLQASSATNNHNADPILAKVYAGLGAAHMQNDAVELADEAYRRSLEIQPQQADVLYAHSRVLLRLGRRDEAQQALDRFEQLKSGLGGSSLLDHSFLNPPFVDHD